MKFQRENAKDILNDENLLPLFQKHWEEISFYKDIPLSPDYAQYKKLDEMGILRVYTARDTDNKLVGYCVFFVNKNLHYSSAPPQAMQDIIFIDPEKRGFGAKFILWTEKQLAAEGVAVLFHHIKTKTPHTIDLFRRLGYENIDLILGKRLDK